ncbi:LTA synthase family protein [Lactobacillus psittaci]|uniref:Alkaline phosphatase famliy n=1 Tax=Lactobacillus psittaci DSM 15354 TaxID=1122152 RepID=A0A0R1S3B5_9LACO|nr:LTA synthase family protein [Lactobacillus psittaci]KRL63425.1 alkaline phosphatase famliy [Lactobacillus psittaci DSM 15354]
MKKKKKFNWACLNTRTGFLTLLTLLFTLKYIYAGYIDFNLGLSDPYQHFIMWTSPIGSMLLLLSLALYIKKPLLSYIGMLIMDFINTALLFANIVYYRQFSDFLTIKTIANTSKVSQGLGKSAVSLLHPDDILIFIDLVVIIALLIFKIIKIDQRKYRFSANFAVTSLACLIIGTNLFLSETSRPRLLRNTFDRVYVVKYLGLSSFTTYDTIKSFQTSDVSKTANADELNQIIDFTQKNYAKPNKSYFGLAKNKNVIIIHLESFQQFLINLKVNGKEVTPFLNSLYRNKNTLSYSNFFHQVGLGRTSDAENMLETGTFGISDGSLFTSLGSNNTFQAAPQILRQSGYTSAVFHGNVGSFWNRNDVYKNLGYNYFFDKNYFSNEKQDLDGYGVKDKLLFAESIKYLEQMQQPFYVKYITVTNHIPFQLDDEDKDPDFKTSDTSDQTINNYFETAHYLDQAVKEFFDYLKKSGLYNNTMVVIYGDHYGISNSENNTLAPLLNMNSASWSSYDNTQLQRVPFMIHMPGIKGGIKKTYAGEIDVLPTLLHLLGIKTKNYIQFGTDILSKYHRQVVVFRNGTIVTPDYVIINGKASVGNVYNNKTGKLIKHFSANQKKLFKHLTSYASQSLHYSDILNNRNLLRLYTPKGFIPDDPSQFNYLTQFKQMIELRQQLGKASTSMYSQHKGTTTNMYSTDAPELKNRTEEITTVPASIAGEKTGSDATSVSSQSSATSSNK